MTNFTEPRALDQYPSKEKCVISIASDGSLETSRPPAQKNDVADGPSTSAAFGPFRNFTTHIQFTF